MLSGGKFSALTVNVKTMCSQNSSQEGLKLLQAIVFLCVDSKLAVIKSPTLDITSKVERRTNSHCYLI